MMESFLLVLLLTMVPLLSTWKDLKVVVNTFEVHMIWTLSRNAVMSFVDHGEQHRLHQIALQQQQIYSLSFREGVLNQERHL
jgi:hypothetical protein